MNWLFNSDGRRAGAFVALMGAAFMFTVYAAVVLYIIRDSIGLVFWLGVGAHLQIAIITTGFIALFVKRSLTVTRTGISINDESYQILSPVADPTASGDVKTISVVSP